jgi:hypothetical protein
MSNSGVEYDIKNKERYDDFKIIKNNLVIIPSKITETNILPIITNISYDDGNVKLDNYIYHYLHSLNDNKQYNIKKNIPTLDIINESYTNIIIYQNNGSKYNCYILNNTDITTLLNNDSNIEKSYKDQNNNFEEYYLKNKGEEEGEKYIRFKIFISLIIISIDNENLIIFDYNKISPLNIQQYNIATQDDVPITNTEFENLNKLVITKAIYEDNPFDYLSEPQ